MSGTPIVPEGGFNAIHNINDNGSPVKGYFKKQTESLQRKDGKNFIVGLSLNFKHDGIEVNSIRGIFPKDTHKWINWIQEGKALYLDKEKIQNLINQQRTNLADVEYLDLDSSNNIIENFRNPSVETGNNQKNSEMK